MIPVETLRELVRNTAPFLFARDWGEHEFLTILRDAHPNYFAMCVAAHHATVATFVPTDVDTKIRGLLWQQTSARERLRAMAELAVRAMQWDLSFVSRRTVDTGFGPVSGHDGERMSILAGGHGRLMEVHDEEYAAKLADAIEAELDRELQSFARAKGVDQLKLAASIAHNLGDLNQGISFWKEGERMAESRARFLRLGHEDAGRFAAPMRIYRELLSPEGHRHYPLRGVKALRQSPDLLLPQAPFLDDWGATIATHPLLTFDDRRDVVAALIDGCRKIPGQQGYYRALSGMQAADQRQFEKLCDALPATGRKEARAAELRKRIAVPQPSFESSMVKRARALVS